MVLKSQKATYLQTRQLFLCDIQQTGIFASFLSPGIVQLN